MSSQNIINVINNYKVNRTQFINDADNHLFMNKFIDHIYVINLETDRLRRNYIIKLMEKYSINFELIIVPKLQHHQYEIIGNNKLKMGEAGCYLSHMFCLQDAINNNYDNIIIFEDDIIMHKNFHNLFQKTMTENQFDIFMLGASDFSFRQINATQLNSQQSTYIPKKKTIFLCGTYAIQYSKAGYKHVFNARLNKPTFMDDDLVQFLGVFENTFHISYPNLILADLSTTNIEHNFWITSPLMDTYYYRKCFAPEFNFLVYNFINLKILENCDLNFSLSYKENILECIYKLFKNDSEKITLISNRLEYSFFTTDDLKYIIEGYN